jgi:hypothetical protein
MIKGGILHNNYYMICTPKYKKQETINDAEFFLFSCAEKNLPSKSRKDIYTQYTQIIIKHKTQYQYYYQYTVIKI